MIKTTKVLALHSGSRVEENSTEMLLTYVEGSVSIKEEKGGGSCAQRRRAKRSITFSR